MTTQNMTKSILWLSLLVILVLLSSCSKDKDSGTEKNGEDVKEKASSRPILFVCCDWAPYEYIENKKPTGMDTELIEIIMKKLGLPYEIKLYPWSRTWLMIEKGAADACLSISYKKDREPYIYYTEEQRQFNETGEIPSDYIFVSEYVFFINKRHKAYLKFKSYEQLIENNYRIGINQDYAYNPEFNKANLKKKSYPTHETAFKALMNNEIDMYPLDKAVGLSTIKALGLSDKITYIPKTLFTKPYVIGFCKKSNYPDLELVMKRCYEELSNLRKNGTYQKIYDKYTK